MANRPHVEQIDHTADVGLRVLAASPQAAFQAVAEGMFDIMLNLERVEPAESREVAVEASGWEDLLVTWLEELLYLYESERLALHSFEIRELDERHLGAEVSGEPIDPERHEPGVQIKAVTYHQLQAEATKEGFRVQVIFDI